MVPDLKPNTDSRLNTSRTAIETLILRSRFQWLYTLLFILGGQVLEPRISRVWQWKVFTFISLALILIRFYLDVTTNRPAGITPLYVRVWFTCKILNNFLMSAIVAVAYAKFGFDPSSFVATVLLSSFSYGTLVTTRTNLRILQFVVLSYTLLPAITAFWVGGIAGYAIGAHLLGVVIFCFQQGKVSSREYWAVLHLNRDLRIASRKAEASAKIKAELTAEHARQSAIAGERTRIAAEWHDTLLAGFSAISWQLDVARNSLPKSAREAAKALNLAATILSHYRTESRLIISGMQTGVADDETLAAALSRTLSSLAEGRSTAIEINAEGPCMDMANAASHQLIRICHEAVSNALQHASAQSIKVKIRNEVSGASVEIEDDGVGFDSQLTSPGHYGLSIMRERARRIGATLQIESQPGAGSRIALSIPLAPAIRKLTASILLVDDQFFARLALRSVLAISEDLTILGEADTGAAAIECFRQHRPDVTILDLRLPDMTGIDVMHAIRSIDPLASIIVVSNSDDAESIHLATEAGAAAFLAKDASSQELLLAVSAVVSGKTYLPLPPLETLSPTSANVELSPYERDVLEQLIIGLSDSDIALHLGISEKTVRAHVAGILSKLGASGRAEAATIAVQRGLAEQPSHFASAARAAHV